MTSSTDEAFVAVMGNTRERNHEENDSITDVEVVVKEIERTVTEITSETYVEIIGIETKANEIIYRDSDGFDDFDAEFEEESGDDTEVCIPQEILEAVLEGLHYEIPDEDIKSIQSELTDAVVHVMEDNINWSPTNQRPVTEEMISWTLQHQKSAPKTAPKMTLNVFKFGRFIE